MNAQIESLKAKLREAGLEVGIAKRWNGREQVTQWTINSAASRSPVCAITVDHADDGYSLFLMVPSIRISDDVEAILAALTRANRR